MNVLIDGQGRQPHRHDRARGRRAAGAAVVLAVAACSAVDSKESEDVSQHDRFGDANVSSHELPNGDIETTVGGPGGEPLLITIWHEATHVLTYQLPTSEPFDLQLDIESVTTDGTDSMAYYIYQQTSAYHDSPGCDAPAGGLTTACYSPCCANHDQCYDNNGCSQKSWFFLDSWSCIGCNAQAVGCVGYKATTGNCEGECSGQGENQVQCSDKSYGQYCAGGCGDQGNPPCGAKLLSGESYDDCDPGGMGGGSGSENGAGGSDPGGYGGGDPSGGNGGTDPGGGEGASNPSGGEGASDPGGEGASDPPSGSGDPDPSSGSGDPDPSSGSGE
jgi:hypothetical protein